MVERKIPVVEMKEEGGGDLQFAKERQAYRVGLLTLAVLASLFLLAVFARERPKGREGAVEAIVPAAVETEVRFGTPTGETAPPEGAELPQRGLPYVVKAGDTLSSIGQQAGLDWTVIAEANNLKPPYTLTPGQVLKVPE